MSSSRSYKSSRGALYRLNFCSPEPVSETKSFCLRKFVEVHDDEDTNFIKYILDAFRPLCIHQLPLRSFFKLAVSSELFNLFLSVTKSLHQPFERGIESLQHFLDLSRQDALPFLSINSIFQNHLLWKMVPHSYWRRSLISSRRYTATQI